MHVECAADDGPGLQALSSNDKERLRLAADGAEFGASESTWSVLRRVLAACFLQVLDMTS